MLLLEYPKIRGVITLTNKNKEKKRGQVKGFFSLLINLSSLSLFFLIKIKRDDEESSQIINNA